MRIMALDYAGGHPCDTAFLDVEMAGMSGMALAERLRRMKPDVNIIFVTGHGSYRDEAFGLHASGYLMKPVTARKVREELKDLRYPVAPARRVRIRTFGNFEVYLDGKPLMFRYSRTGSCWPIWWTGRGPYAPWGRSPGCCLRTASPTTCTCAGSAGT